MTREEFWNFIFSMSVAIPASIGLFRAKKVDASYYPFLVYLFISLANELFRGLVLTHYEKKYTIVDWQLFNLFEALILYLQMYVWLFQKRFQRTGKILFAVLVAGWLLESFVYSSIYAFNPVFIVSYSFLLVLLSVQAINRIIISQNRIPLHKNAMFIISVAMVLYFIYYIFVFTLQARGISRTNTQLMSQVFRILVYVNAFTNILYGLAAYYIPQKLPGKGFFETGKK